MLLGTSFSPILCFPLIRILWQSISWEVSRINTWTHPILCVGREGSKQCSSLQACLFSLGSDPAAFSILHILWLRKVKFTFYHSTGFLTLYLHSLRKCLSIWTCTNKNFLSTDLSQVSYWQLQCLNRPIFCGSATRESFGHSPVDPGQLPIYSAAVHWLELPGLS